MILGGADIKEALDSGVWKVYRGGEEISSEELTINPNSVNVSLDWKILLPHFMTIDLHSEEGGIDGGGWTEMDLRGREDEGVTVFPGNFFLMSVQERFDCSRPLMIHGRERFFAPMIDGRSTSARCGLSVHETAGFGDVGFEGYFTLEVSSRVPVKVRFGDEIAQISFQEVSCQGTYKGAYKDIRQGPLPPSLGRHRFRREGR